MTEQDKKVYEIFPELEKINKRIDNLFDEFHIRMGFAITNKLLQNVIDYIKSEDEKGVLLEARHIIAFIESLKKTFNPTEE